MRMAVTAPVIEFLLYLQIGHTHDIFSFVLINIPQSKISD